MLNAESGLQCSLLQKKKPKCKIYYGLQNIHSRCDHWIVASTFGCSSDVKVFDSVYTSVDKDTKVAIDNLFQIQKSLRLKLCRSREAGMTAGCLL